MKTTTKDSTRIQSAAMRGSSRARGATVVSAGAVGRYVGTTPGGSEWIAYSDADYAVMTKAFDAKYGK